MRFFTTEGFAPKGGLGVYGPRIWLEREDSEGIYLQARVGLNPLSCWGSADKSGENYEAWEFSWVERDAHKFEEAKALLLKLGFVEEEFETISQGFPR